MRKAYYGVAGSQIHYYESGQGETVVLLPPAPHSGFYFKTVIPHLSDQYHVLAPDYPGYGGSDVLQTPASISAYAHALMPLLESYSPVHLVGFHSGNLVALELALLRPDVIQNVVMIDVPYFEAKTRASLDAKLGQNFELPQELADLAKGFEANVLARREDLGDDRAYDIWVESLRPGRWQNEAFHAAFTYNCEVKFASCKTPMVIIATQSGLLEPTRKASGALDGSILKERLDINSAVFEIFASDIAAEIKSTLRT